MQQPEGHARQHRNNKPTTISFRPEVNVRSTLRINDYTNEERQATYYDANDFMSFEYEFYRQQCISEEAVSGTLRRYAWPTALQNSLRKLILALWNLISAILLGSISWLVDMTSSEESYKQNLQGTTVNFRLLKYSFLVGTFGVPPCSQSESIEEPSGMSIV